MGGIVIAELQHPPKHARDHLPDGPDPIDFPSTPGTVETQYISLVTDTSTGVASSGSDFADLPLDLLSDLSGVTAFSHNASSNVELESVGLYAYSYKYRTDAFVDSNVDIMLKARLASSSSSVGDWSGEFAPGSSTIKDFDDVLMRHSHQNAVANDTDGSLVIELVGWVKILPAQAASLPIEVEARSGVQEDGSFVTGYTLRCRAFWVYFG